MRALLQVCFGALLVGVGPALAEDPPKTSTKGRTGWFGAPIVAYTPETGLAYGAAGLRYFVLSGGRDSVARLDARYTTRQQLIVRARSRVYWDDNFLRFWGSFEQFPDQFFGIGPTTPTTPEAYTPVEWRVELEYERRIWQRLFAGVAYELTHVTLNDVVPGGRLDTDPRARGRDGGWQSGLGIQFTWDDRDNVNATREGTYFRASVIAFDDAFGSAHSYRRTTLDLRHFVPLPHGHVLALRGFARNNVGDTPFYDLAMLGGRTLMRGLFEGRYRDDHLAALQVEYRLPIWWRFGATAFAAAGEVGDVLADIDVRNAQVTGGAGLRIAISQPSRLNARVDLGASADGFKLYLTFNEAF